MEQPALLEMRGISKEFPGVKALDNVSLTVRPGTVHPHASSRTASAHPARSAHQIPRTG